ncbi:hypothetical protein J8L85_14410 [Maribacter sp. MMG018]|uniref:sugar-transfer associated ATP-grasp domain-containing protein n=1 Tax=Maribacter sp. MMG018 TaxID=2822688 RepID=UPI001B39356B|nr:sugar-transfer associated ATP-grasp domain-containing protein [Maribacter sp. MMG018]MBQ4915645.1 hypothetical protein [Maribacter sp. MMG018]
MGFRKLFYQFIWTVKYLRVKYVYNKKIALINKKNKCEQISSLYKNNIKETFGLYGFKKIPTEWHRFYTNTIKKEDVQFIPEILFYSRVEPSLNNSTMYPALEDKNLLDKFFDDSYLPKSIIKNINGFFYVNNLQVSKETAIETCAKHKSMVIKPSIGTVGGKGVKKIELSNNSSQELDTLFNKYKTNYIVQEIVEQHPQLALLNNTSLNTIRIITYMRQEEVIPLSAVIRIGRAGSFTDNLTSGGYACGINENGELRVRAFDTYGKGYSKTDNGTILENFQIPCFDSIISSVKEQHQNMPHFKLISWDIAINNKSEVIIVEFNAMGQDINLHQMCNGPLFGKYFDEILNITKNYDPLKHLIEYGG